VLHATAALVRDQGLSPGVMVEIPAAALMADQLLEAVDFASLGTNDLAQYTMAADRLAPELGHLTDSWQPAMLRLLEMTAQAGRRAGKPVGVCGEAAADPDLAAVLVGMGVTSLSAAVGAIPEVGARLAGLTSAQCGEAAAAALAAPDALTARTAAREILGRG
jgi:phosphotransferase system enzyme I (PtsI)